VLLYSQRAYSWSPDSQRIAVALVSSLEIVDAETGAITVVLPRFEGLVNDVQWSPDGTRIAFVGAEGVYTVRTDGSALHLLAGGGFSPAWSPDSRRIAFVGRDNEISTVDVDGNDERSVTAAARPITVAWSPNGDQLAFADQRGVWTVPVNGGEPREIAADTPYDVSWSPRADKIAYTGTSGTWIVALDPLTAVRLAGQTPFDEEAPTWSGPERVTYAATDLCGIGIYDAEIGRPGLAQRLTNRCSIFGDPGSTHARLLIKVYRTPRSRARTWTLRCGPVGGTLPHAPRACARLLALPDPFGSWPEGEPCGSPLLTRATAVVTGTFRRKAVRAGFSRRSPCAAKRWGRVALLFPGVPH
jgi:dipeptidyl aminopeptidase/acylaminoacyl peptidase